MTDNLLVLIIIATVYLILGSIHEERILAEKFGAAFLEYRDKVPRFISSPRCRYSETAGEATGPAAVSDRGPRSEQGSPRL
jgi:hypothetical protein